MISVIVTGLLELNLHQIICTALTWLTSMYEHYHFMYDHSLCRCICMNKLHTHRNICISLTRLLYRHCELTDEVGQYLPMRSRMDTGLQLCNTICFKYTSEHIACLRAHWKVTYGMPCVSSVMFILGVIAWVFVEYYINKNSYNDNNINLTYDGSHLIVYM